MVNVWSQNQNVPPPWGCSQDHYKPFGTLIGPFAWKKPLEPLKIRNMTIWRRRMYHRDLNKGQYLGPWAIKWKNKDTLFSRTIKVEEKKVSLVFWFVAQEPKYGHCVFWTSGGGGRAIVTGKTANISDPEPYIKKIRILCFLKLLKLKKGKCP